MGLTAGLGVGDGVGVGAAGAAASQGKRSVLGRLTRPPGPLIQVVLPLVKAVQLSALRHTSRPLVVCCWASPLSTVAWLSTQSPTSPGVRSCRALKPSTNWQDGAC